MEESTGALSKCVQQKTHNAGAMPVFFNHYLSAHSLLVHPMERRTQCHIHQFHRIEF